MFRKSNKKYTEAKDVSDILQQRFASFDVYGLGGGGSNHYRNNSHSRFEDDSESDY